jgi:hypothetical protein
LVKSPPAVDRSSTADLAFLAVAAAIMAVGYGFDLVGFGFSPAALLACTAAAGVTAIVALRPRIDGWFAGVIAATFAYAMWIASPSFLPVTNGPDVVHHLQLIHAIGRTGGLPHDAALYPYLLEMMGYTPGSHLLAAAAGAWLRLDPLRLVYPLAALFAAVKAGSLYVLGRRAIGAVPGARALAVGAPLLAFVPAAYFFGSFVQFFFYAQVISESFAIGLLVALTAWIDRYQARDVGAAALCAVGVVLSWPVWLAPCALTVALVAGSAPIAWRRRIAAAGWMLGPACAVAVVHQALHRGAASIVTSSGAVTAPSTATFGLGFLVAAAIGVVYAVRERTARVVLVFLAATLFTAAALAALARFRSTYMAFKMMYLAVLPAAVLGALALARVSAALSGRFPRMRALAVGLPLIAVVLLLRGRVPTHRLHGSLSIPARDVGLWARDHAQPACIDYFSRYWLTGYWLHLDVLGNPRLSDRMRGETFDFPDVAAKWIEGRGLPYAIVEDMTDIPREIRPDMDPLYRSGSFVVVRNRRAAACRD